MGIFNFVRNLTFMLVAIGAGTTAARAQTSCNAANLYTLNWDAQTPLATNLGTGNRLFTATNGAGGSIGVTMSFAGDITHYVDSGFGQTPNISVQNTGGIAAGENTLFLAADFVSYAANLNLGANIAAVRFSFSVPVREVTFKVLDIDYAAGQFRDWVEVSGSNGALAYAPTITTPQGRSNTGTPGLAAPGVAYVGPGTVSGAAIANGQISGTNASAFTENFGLVTNSFAQPVTQVEVRYGNGPTSTMTGTAGVQSISIHDISFCPMPNLTVTKTSTPASTILTDPNHFNIPGADVDYTITVVNSGGSTVDLNGTFLADILPANMIFYNGDIDTGTAGTQNFVFTAGTSGLTLAAGNISYSNNGGTSYTYVPTAGYDANATALRFIPQGSMAANSSFTLRFRTRIK